MSLNNTPLYARLYPHGDCAVLKQVYLSNEYKPLSDIFINNKLSIDNLKIIDAGANVGYTTAYLFAYFQDAEIVCIEPDKGNTLVLKKNLHPFIEQGKAFLYENALMPEKNISLSTNRNFRDGKDYAISVSISDVETDLKSVTIDQIMKERNWKHVDILKIDIEGAERFIFKEGTNKEYLDLVKVLAIEIHDEYNIREMIYEQLRSRHYFLFHSGETTFAVNQKFLNLS